MRKKMLALVLAAAMVMAAGCGATQTDTTTTADQSTETATADTSAETDPADTVAAGEVPTVIWWNVGDLPENAEKWQEEVNTYLEEQIGVRVDYRTIPWGDWGTKHSTIINSGEYFDIMFTDLGIYNKFVDMGAFADLTELLPTAAPELYSYIPAEVWQGVTSPRGIFAIPTYKDCARTGFYVFDDSYLQKYNIDCTKIQTMADLDTYFRTLKEGEGASFYPLQMTKATPWNGIFDNYDKLGSSLSVIGVANDDSEYKVVNTLEQADVTEGLTYLHQWYLDGIINPDANVQTEQNRQRPFFRGVGWPGAVSIWQVSEGVEKYSAVREFGPVYTTDSIQGALNSISANSENKEAALKLLEFVNTDHKARDMFAYGIEGENFEYVEENVVRPLNDIFGNMSRYSQATFFSMSTVEGSQKDQYDEIKAQNAEASSSALLGFTMDMTAVMDEAAACRTIWSKYDADLLTGASDPKEVIPQIISEMKAVGLDKIMEEAQRQVDAFVK